MECNISKYTVFSCKTVLESFSEEKINIDMVIPDYCLAAEKIIKCEIISYVTSKNFNDNKLTIEGKSKINIIYIDDDMGSIRSICEYSPFTQSFALSEQLMAYKTKIKLRTSNVTCRLQNSRRISVKGVVGIAVKVMGNTPIDAIENIDECKVETLFDKIKNYTFTDSGEIDAHITGDLEIGENINEIISCDCNTVISETKAINNKVLVKGKADVTVIYTTGEDVYDFESVNGEIPFSEVIDIAGVDEDSICDIEILINNIRCDISGQSENNVVNVEIDATINGSAYNENEIKLLKDVYSREHDLHINSKDVVIESMYEQIKFTEIIGDTIKIDFDDARIIDVVTHAVIKNVSSKENKMFIEGDVNATIYAQNGSEYRIIDKSYPFCISKEIKNIPDYMRCEANIFVKDCSFSMVDENINVKTTLDFSVLLFLTNNYIVVDDIVIDYENSPRNLAGKVILYYADKGEKLWDIAKKYYSSVDIIKRDNEISDNTLSECKMLLIARN